MKNPRYYIGDDLYDASSKKMYQTADIKLKDNEYRYGYIINNNMGWVREEDASEEQLVTFDRISTYPKLNLESLNSKKMEDKKPITPRFKEGEHVYINVNGRMGTIVSAPSYKGYPYYVKTDSTPGYYYYEYELKPIAEGKKPNIPIKSIKSLIKKSVIDPSSNQAEKKAIDLFVHSVHTMSDSYVGDPEYYVDEDNLKEFKDQLGILEKMAIEFYKKIKP